MGKQLGWIELARWLADSSSLGWSHIARFLDSVLGCFRFCFAVLSGHTIVVTFDMTKLERRGREEGRS